MLQKLGQFVLWMFGWKLLNNYPKQIRKSIILVIPHTSNWDYPIGILLKWAIGEDVKYLIKNSHIRFPYGWLIKVLGGYPVDRSKKSNLVEQIVEIFNEKEEFILNIAPEGTRNKPKDLKTGFYYIALNANIPLVLCSFDWQKGYLNFSDPLYMTGDYEADIKIIWNFFKGIKGKFPENGWTLES